MSNLFLLHFLEIGIVDPVITFWTQVFRLRENVQIFPRKNCSFLLPGVDGGSSYVDGSQLRGLVHELLSLSLDGL